MSLTVCRPVLNSCSNCTWPRSPPLPLHPKPSMHALILYTREGKIQQLPMQSHPASSVPWVLLIPRSCGCLGPLPLTPSAYLSCKGSRRSEGENGRGEERMWDSVTQTFGCEVRSSLIQQIREHWLLRCDGACISGGGRTGEAWCCLLSLSLTSMIEYFISGAQTGTRRFQISLLPVTPLWWWRREAARGLMAFITLIPDCFHRCLKKYLKTNKSCLYPSKVLALKWSCTNHVISQLSFLHRTHDIPHKK